MSPTRPSAPDAHERARSGTAAAVLAYAIWGLFPLYFHALKPAGAWEILGHRIAWTLAFCAAVLVIRRDLGWIVPTLRRPKLAAGIALAALLIAVNWVIYVFAVLQGRTYEAALGYFLNPIVTVALGVFVLKERLGDGEEGPELVDGGGQGSAPEGISPRGGGAAGRIRRTARRPGPPVR